MYFRHFLSFYDRAQYLKIKNTKKVVPKPFKMHQAVIRVAGPELDWLNWN